MTDAYPWPASRQAEQLNRMVSASGGALHDVPDAAKDEARLPLQRHRDRIVWCNSFKRLAHKTQVFPHQYSDHQRHRMTHSLEVMQLSTSIARTLGLNPILCEAIALVHDIGHAPFGHAGETALDKAFRLIEFGGLSPDVRGLDCFSHYEQGLDVVSYIESPDPASEATGLHLDPRILEGILKHTYDHVSSDAKAKSLRFLLAKTKYTSIPAGSGSLEAQVVRICDKISYFVSDIEDGLVIGALHLGQLLPWRGTLFEALPPEEAGRPTLGDDQHAFKLARDRILTKVVESVLRQTATNLAKTPSELTVAAEPHIAKALADVYTNVQKRMFSENILVIRANRRAGHIVSCLFCQYLRHPELIPWGFRKGYSPDAGAALYPRLRGLYTRSGKGDLQATLECDLRGWHEDRRTGDSAANCAQRLPAPRCVGDVICAKDYVCGMTDNFAEVRYKADVHCLQSRIAWEAHQMDRTILSGVSSVR